MILIYDATLEGFLTLVYEVYYSKLKPTQIIKSKSNNFIFDETIEIKTDKYKSEKVLTSIKNKFTAENFQTILNIFLCDNYDFEMSLLEYIKLGFNNQLNLQNINITAIRDVQNLQSELLKVAHKIKGFLRFEELDDKTLYAKYENKFNILIFIAKHFLMRYGNQHFIIHDIGRNIAFVKNENLCDILNVDSYEMPILSKNEADFKRLWKTFFNAVAIKSRENYKLQRSQVPLIYRTYMNEFS